MKNILFFIVVAVALASCKTQSGIPQKALDIYKKHCAEDSKIEKLPDGNFAFRLHCKNLHDTAQVNKYIGNSRVCYSPTGAELDVVGTSKDSIPNVWEISKAVSRGFK